MFNNLKRFLTNFTVPSPYSDITKERFPYRDPYDFQFRAMYVLGASGPLRPGTITPSGLTGGYAPTTGTVGVSTVNDANNQPNLTKVIQPSGTGGAQIAFRTSDQILSAASIVEPGR